MEINTTSAGSLPGSSHHEPIHVEIMADDCSVQPDHFGCGEDPLVTPPAVTHASSEDARADSIGGDSTSVSLTGQEFDIAPQKRKGSQVKRRILSSEQAHLDNETSLEKILKNLYENTALHEKIAENINRGRNSQTKVLAISDGDGEDYTDVAVNADVSTCGNPKKNKYDNSPGSKLTIDIGSRSKSNEAQSLVSGASDTALLKELDHIVPAIVSETTSDPAFESLLEEVFGSPESASSKNNGSYQASQVCTPEFPVASARPLSTPVPPPTSTPLSTSVPQQHSQPLLPLFRTPSSVLDATCALSSHTLTSPPLHLSASIIHSPSSPTLTSTDCIQRIQYSTISSPSHPPSDIATSVADLTSKGTRKKRQKKMQSNQVVVKGPVTRSTTRISRSAASTVTSQNTAENVGHDATSDSQMKTPPKMKSQSPFSLQTDTCPSNTTSNSSVTKCIQESATSQSSNALASSDSTLKSFKSNDKKKKRSKHNKKTVKEDERSLGEQLLQEFANFQSTRPDKISESEGSGDSQKTEPVKVKPLECEEILGENDVPNKEPYTNVAVNNSPHDVAFSDTGTEELPCLTEEPCKLPASLTSHNAAIVYENAETEEAAASAVVSSPRNIPSPSKKINLITNNLSMKQSENEFNEGSATELLPDKPYDKESPRPEASTNCENNEGDLTMMPSNTMPVMSSTIPGIVCASPAERQEDYTLTELIPVNPNGIPYLEGTFSVQQETGILYPMPQQNCIPLSQNIIPGNLDLVPASVSVPSVSCPVSEKQVAWDTSIGVLPVSAEAGVFRPGQMAQTEQVIQQPPNVLGGNDEGTTTILLPPIRKEEENEGRIITVSSADGIKDNQPTMMILQLPSQSVPIIPQSLGTVQAVKQEGIPGVGLYPNAKKRAPVLIAPLGIPPNPYAQTPVFSGEESEHSLQSSCSYTLPNNVSISWPNCSNYSNSFTKKKKSYKRKNKSAEDIQKNSPEISSKTANVTKEKKQGARKARKQTKQKEKENEDLVSKNNIISTALSFALNSLSPNKDTELSGNCKLQEQVSPHTVAECSVAGMLTELPSVDNYCNEVVPDELQAQNTAIEQTLLKTGPKNDHLYNAQAAEEYLSNTRSSTGGQKESTEQNIHVKPAENANVSESVDTKYRLNRSPQLKALLHLSQSISPSKKIVAQRMFPSTESPFVVGFPKRGSQSTPSYKSSHIRALDFSTPQKHRAHGRSPRKVVASLRFSPPARKRSPKKTIKSPLSNPSQLREKLLSEKKRLRKISEKNEITRGSNVNKEDADYDKKNIREKELLSRKESLSLSPLGQRKMSTASTSEESFLGKDTVDKVNTMLHAREDQQQYDDQLNATGDDENLVLRIEDDSSSSDAETQGTDPGSIELFDLPEEMSSLEDLTESQPCESSCNLDAKRHVQNPPQSLTNREQSATVQTDAICSSDMLDLDDAKRMKTLKTPYKDGELLCSNSNEVFPITPLCLEPTTPYFPSASRVPSSQDDDLNTPIPPGLPKTPAGKSPLIKDYPQGPYSNSSVSTSYYIPSEHSVTDSEGFSPSHLQTVWEETPTEVVSSPTYQGKKSPECSRGNTSPSKMSRKMMGQVIEQEIVKLFSGDTSCSSPDNQVQNRRSFNTNSSLVDSSSSSKIETKLKDPSKGKQKRVPSKKYQKIDESTCSEDEFEQSSSTKYSNLCFNQNHKTRSNVSLRNAKENKGKGMSCSVEDKDAVVSALGAKKPSHELGTQRVRQRQRKKVKELPKSDIVDNSKTVPRKQDRRTDKSVIEGTVKSMKESEKLMNDCNAANEQQNCDINAIQNTSTLKKPSLGASINDCSIPKNNKIAPSDSKRRTVHQVKDLESVASSSSISFEADLALDTSGRKSPEVRCSSVRGRKRISRKRSTEKDKSYSPTASKAKQCRDIFGSDYSFTDESDSETESTNGKKAIGKMEINRSCASMIQGPQEENQNDTRRNQNDERRSQRHTRNVYSSRGKLWPSKASKAPAVIPKSRAAKVTLSRVKRGGRTASTRGSKLHSHTDDQKVTTKPSIGDESTHYGELSEAVVFDDTVMKEISKSKANVRGKGTSRRSLKGKQSSRGRPRRSRTPAVASESMPVRRSGRTRNKSPFKIDVKEVTIEALIGSYNPHSRDLSEIDEPGNEKEPSNAKVVVKRKGKKGSKDVEIPGNGLRKLDIVAEIHKPPEGVTDVSGVGKNVEHFEKSIPKKLLSKEACHESKQPVTPFSSWGSESRLSIQEKSKCFVTPRENLKTRWSASLGLQSPLIDVNVTDTEDESPGGMLHKTIPEEIITQHNAVKRLSLSSHSSGCARTISFTDMIPNEAHHCLEAEDLRETHSVTPRVAQQQRTGKTGSSISEPHRGLPSETLTLCAQDNESVALVSSASISSLLNDKHLHEFERKIELASQESLKVTTWDRLNDMPQKPIAEMTTFHKKVLTSTLSIKDTGAESPKSVKSASDLLKSSEQQHVISHEPLLAPEKKSNQVCHSIVSKNLSTSAQNPVSDEVYTQSQNSNSLNNVCETYESFTENAKSERSCIRDNQERENMTVDFKRAEICKKTEKNLTSEKNCLKTSPSTMDSQEMDKVTGSLNLKLNNGTDEISDGKQGNKEEIRANVDRESHSINTLKKKHIQSSVQIDEHEDCGDAGDEMNTSNDLSTMNSDVDAMESKNNENSSNSHAEKEVKETLKRNSQQKDVHFKEAISSTELGEDDIETKTAELEDDSDVLRIEVPSEHENDDGDDLLDAVNLKVTDFIDILSLNLESKGRKAKRRTIATKRGMKRALKISGVGNKVKGKGTKKGRTRQLTAGRKSLTYKSKKNLMQREKGENSTQQSIPIMGSKIHSRNSEGIISPPENVQKEENFINSGNFHNDLISDSSNAEVQSTNHKRKRDADSSGESSGLIKKDEFHQSTVKKRRIQPIRIGEVDRASCQTRKDWTEKEDKGRMVSELGENKISSEAAVPCKLDKDDGNIQGQHEKVMGSDYGSLRREVLLNSGAGGLSERSVSSLSSVSPGRLLISESPRDLDSSPAHHCDPAPIPSPCTSIGSPITKCHSPIQKTPDGPMTTQSRPFDSCIHRVPANDCDALVDGVKMIQEQDEAESEQSTRASVSYLIESETSRELDEDIGCGRQRKARQMACELYSGGSLEIAHSPGKQLTIMTNHQNFMSEESVSSFSSMPPTPGKHLFVPPAPASTVLSSGCTASKSSSNHESVKLPFKKRRKMIFVPEPVKRKQAQKLANRINISKFLDKIHQDVPQPKEPSGSDSSISQT